MKIKKKDRKILHQLDLNSRQSTASIGKKIGLHKASVNYRLQYLEKNGIIKKYYTVIDSFKLGYEVLRFYINFQYTTPAIENEIIQYFKKSKFVWALYTINGWFDLDIIFWIKNRHEFYNFWKTVLNRYGDYFQEERLSFLIGLSSHRNTYLDDNPSEKRTETKVTYIGEECIPKNIDSLDLKILKIITTNARISTTDIANQLNETRSRIISRLKKLSKELGLELEITQSDHEGEIVELIGKCKEMGVSAIVINPAAYTHTSVAIRDAISAVKINTPFKINP